MDTIDTITLILAFVFVVMLVGIVALNAFMQFKKEYGTLGAIFMFVGTTIIILVVFWIIGWIR